jgi:hypothetical protein
MSPALFVAMEQKLINVFCRLIFFVARTIANALVAAGISFFQYSSVDIWASM